MIHVRSDNVLVARSLEAMMRLVIARGGYVHAAACIEEQDGSIRTICRDPLAIGQPLFKVPESLLVPTDDLDWSERNDMMDLSSPPVDFSPDRQEMLGLFITIYNATDKMGWFVGQAAQVLLRDPELAAQLAQVNPRDIANTSTPAAAFIQTRYYASKRAQGDMAGTSCLMPLIDFMNHHHEGSKYRHDAGQLMVDITHPDAGDECFSDYGNYRDPLSLALGHGYLDPHSTITRSVPLVIDLAGFGRFEILGKRKVSGHRADLPRVEFSDDGLSLSHLSGDARSPHYLHNTLRLAMMASGKRRGINDAAIERALAELPGLILKANEERFSAFRTYLATRPDLPLAALLSEACLRQFANLEQILVA